IIALSEAIDVQRPHRAQTILRIIHPFGKLERSCQRRDDLRAARILTMEGGDPECQEQTHVEPGIRRGRAVKTSHRLFDAKATLAHHRQVWPERDRRHGERNAERDIAMPGECPIQRRSYVIDPGPVRGKQLGGGPYFPFALGTREHRSMIFGVTARDLWELSAL